MKKRVFTGILLFLFCLSLFQPATITGVAARDAAVQETALSDHVVKDAVTPIGTTIDLFDYWIDDEEDRLAEDSTAWKEGNDSDPRGSQGINRDRDLKFGKSVGAGWNTYQSINDWTRSSKPHYGIMKNELKNGYPVLKAGLNVHYKGNSDPNKKSEEASMDYLFDPDVEAAGKASFHDVGGLLQVDERGYYYYNAKASAKKRDASGEDGYASANYAWFDETENKFVLYDDWGVVERNENGFNGQFFPFTDPKYVFEETQGKLVRKKINGEDPVLNHYFGMTMTTRFVQKAGGTTPMGESVTYEFAGDDDVWIFIDDVLVGDLGGNHDTASISIDFSSGEIVVNENDTDEANKSETTIKECFKNADALDKMDWGTGAQENTFADDTYHTLKFFYLERGNYESNLSLKFNLREIPESIIEKEDQEGHPVAGAKFSLYPADYNEEDQTCSIQAGYENAPIYTDTTEADGKFSIWDEETNSPIAFRELYQKYGTQHFILRETAPPPGYCPSPDAWLHFEPDTGVIRTDNVMSSGIYGASMETVTAPAQFQYYEHGAADPEKHLDLNDPDVDLENLKMYALVLKRVNTDGETGTTGNWAPVSGNFETGWTIHHDTEKTEMENIIDAIKANGATGIDHHFALGTGGAFKVTMEYLPGDIEDYYWYLMEKEGMDAEEAAEKARYTVSYYYTTAGSKEEIRAENTYRVDTAGFGKEFSIRLHIPNIKNYLVVEKVDEKGQPINGAKFALYKAGEDGAFIQEDERRYDWAITSSLSRAEGHKVTGEGLLTFPSATMKRTTDHENQEILELGTYYLVEIETPSDDYIKNETPVKVIVDENGIYADAGTAEDGVSTHRAVGSVLRGLVHSARDDGIDATLHNIKVQKLTGKAGEDGKISWSRWDESDDRIERHLYFADEKSLAEVEYLPIPDTSELPVIHEGWSRLEIRLCEDHIKDPDVGLDPERDSVWKENLTGVDLSHLFSSALYITVKNERREPQQPEQGGITVSKTVSGNAADTERPFRFTVELNDRTINGKYGDMWFHQGIAQFSLKHEQSLTATGLPVGVGYQVKEVESADYIVTSTGAEGSIPANETAKAEFKNHREDDPADPDPDPTPDPDPDPTPDPEPEPDPEEEPVDLTVKKVWKLDNGREATESITAALLKDGAAEQTVVLSEDNHWTHTWNDLDADAEWSVKEQNVPDGFTATVETEGTVFTITNDDQPNPDPDPSPDPEPDPDPTPDPEPEPDPTPDPDPNPDPEPEPEPEPDNPTTDPDDPKPDPDPSIPDDPDIPEKPDDPGNPNGFEQNKEPDESKPPQTGQFWWPWWPVIPLTGAGLLLIFLGVSERKRHHDQ